MALQYKQTKVKANTSSSKKIFEFIYSADTFNDYKFIMRTLPGKHPFLFQ